MSPDAFHLLVALAQRPAHGYGLMQAVEEATGGALRIQTGALYRQLKRMLRDGWIEETPAPAGEDSEDARRKYYRLTAEGRRVVSAEAERMRAAVAAAAAARLVPGRS